VVYNPLASWRPSKKAKAWWKQQQAKTWQQQLDDKLPNTLHGLLRVAINDLREVEKQPKKFVVDMGRWIGRAGAGKCKVCMAGAVLARSGVVGLRKLTKDSWDLPCSMMVIDNLRLGCVEDAANELYGDVEGSMMVANKLIPSYFEVPSYSAARDEFYARLEALHKMLKAAGV